MVARPGDAMNPRFRPGRVREPQPIECVLDAEREAEAQLARGEAAARDMVRAARVEARRIRERADLGARALRARARSTVSESIDAMRRARQARVEAAEKKVLAQAHVDQAAHRVADWLLGEDEGGEGMAP